MGLLPGLIPDVERTAVVSPCGRYRYMLGRRWDDGDAVMFLMLNPSTADADIDDPTIRRCMGFARSWGYAALTVGNLFALRATDPRELRKADDPIGPENDGWLLRMARDHRRVVAAWGNHGCYLGRSAAVREMIPGLHRLRVSKEGEPCHPLYLPAHLIPVRMEAP